MKTNVLFFMLFALCFDCAIGQTVKTGKLTGKAKQDSIANANEKVKMDSLTAAIERSILKRIETDKRIADSIKEVKDWETAEATRKADSITAAKEYRVAEEIRKADSATEAQKEKRQIQQQISDANTNLRLANEKLNSIKEFQFGRTQNEKDAQVTAQYKVIQTWEDYIRDLNERLSKY